MTNEIFEKAYKQRDTNYYAYDQYGDNPMQPLAPSPLWHSRERKSFLSV